MVRISLLFSVLSASLILCGGLAAEEKTKPKTITEMVYGEAEKLALGAIPGVEDIAKPIIDAIKSEIISINTPHSTTATFEGNGNDFHVGVGDVYQLTAKLKFKRETRPSQEDYWKVGGWTYGYDVFVGDKLAYSQSLVERKSDTDITGTVVWGEEYSVSKSIYLLATSLGNSDCQGEGSAVVTIRSWMKEAGQTRTSKIVFDQHGLHTVYGPWTPTTKEMAESSSAKTAGAAGGAGQQTVVIHNPWSIGFEEFPTQVNHSDASYDGNIHYSLKQRRDFPLFNIGSPPSQLKLISRITQNSAAHFDVKGRKPPDGNLSFSDKSELLFTHPYHFEQGTTTHFPTGGDRKITFSLEAELKGERQLKAGLGQKFEWSVNPKIVAPDETTCSRFVWDVLDREKLSFDKCLVGSWVATEVAFLDKSRHSRSGGTGFVVSFTDEGLQTTDYSSMAPIAIDDDAWRFKGSATAHITTKDGTAEIAGPVGGPGVLFHMSAKFPDIPFMPFPGLGPGGLGSTDSDNQYVCEKETLSYKASVGGGLGAARPPQYGVKLKRQAQ